MTNYAVPRQAAAPTDAAGLEKAVAEQGDKVRKLKASGAEKVGQALIVICSSMWNVLIE